jgi:Tol biopolymer transport system component
MKISTNYLAPRPRRESQPAPFAYENTDGRPTWSPDSQMVASEKGRDVVVLSRNENKVQNKLGPQGNWVHGPDWSPDGKRITYAVFGHHRDYEDSSWAVYSSSPDGSDAKILMADGRDPEYNPQGDRIAYQFTKSHHPDRIVVIDTDGDNPTFVNNHGFLQADLSWSPGGHQIAYDTRYHGTPQLRITDITGKKDRKLTDGETGNFIDKNPEWSPDGKTILFERHSRRSLANSVMTIDPNTKQVKEVLPGYQRNLDAVWSPDGSKIAFTSDRDNDQYELDIYVADADGTDVVQVTNMKGQEYAPAWSPDGKALAFNRYDREAPTGSKDDVHITELPKELWGNEPEA